MSKAERHRHPAATDQAAKLSPPLPPAPPPPLPPQIAPPQVAPLALQPKSPIPSPAAPPAPVAVPFPVIKTSPKPAPASTTKPAVQPTILLGPATKPAAKFSPSPTPLVSPSAPALSAPAEEQPVDLKAEAVKNAPPFLVSMLVHMILVVCLALFTITNSREEQVEIQATYVDARGQQLLDNSALQSPDAVDLTVDVPVLSYGLVPVDDPFAAPKMPDFASNATKGIVNVDAPNIGLALTGRDPGMKKALSQIYGATSGTDAAVVAALEWLKKQQQRDGGWSLVGPYADGALVENRCAATALALLAFQGYGTTHQKNATLSPDFHDVVDRGWNFLLKMQDKDGFFQHEGSHQGRSYAQGQATIAICEIYGMTKDPKFKRPAQLALDYAHKAQSPELGGWRYQPRLDSDTSVTGWYVMAFQSGLMAGLEVQSPNLDMINKFLDMVAHEGGSQYSYQIGGQPLPSMTAEALLCRQYLGWKHDDPRLRAGIDFLLKNRIDYGSDKDVNVYYWYYATQACHHMDGDDWNQWNEALRREVPAAQIKTGAEKGSWPALNDRWGPHGGRLYVTCLSVFMLETYYRHLPIYKWRLQ